MDNNAKNKNYLVSIIMPCLNAARTIGQAIDSVFNQSYQNIELIIIDDGSTDSSRNIIDQYMKIERRLIVFYNKNNLGVSASRNIGIAKASGKYICFLDADDYLLPGSISSRVSLAQNNIYLVYGPYFKLLPDGRLVKKNPPVIITFKNMLKRNYIGNLTGLYDAEFLGKFLQDPIRHEDYLMWCNIIKLAGFAVSTNSEPLAVYRVSSSSLSGNKIKAFVWHWNVLRRGLFLNLPISLFYQFFYLYFSLSEKLIDIFLKKNENL